MIDRPPTAEDARDLLAAEYVLGLTDAADLPQVEAFILRDAAFAASVAAWRARLAPLDFTAAPASADERLWAGIETSLNLGADESPATAVATAAALAEPVLQPAPSINAREPIARRSSPTRPGALSRWWNSLAFWRFAGLAGSFAALLLAAGLGYFVREAYRQPALIAVLMTPDGAQAAAVVNAYADGRAELVPLAGIDVPPGKAIEIWTLWDKTLGPRSIGVIQRAGRTSLKLEGMPKPQPGQIFEMTIEDAGGSPTGRPTGPVLNKGAATTAL